VNPVPYAAAVANLRAFVDYGRWMNDDAHLSSPTAMQLVCRHETKDK
jgi:hypothetical protein